MDTAGNIKINPVDLNQLSLNSEYRVEWKDHTRFWQTQWRDVEEVRELLIPSVVVSLGKLIANEPEYLILAGTWDNEDDQGDCMLEMLILKGTLQSVHEITTS